MYYYSLSLITFCFAFVLSSFAPSSSSSHSSLRRSLSSRKTIHASRVDPQNDNAAFCMATKKSKYGKSKFNEDNYIDSKFMISGNNLVHVQGVFDGHGERGHLPSLFLHTEFARILQDAFNERNKGPLPEFDNHVPDIWITELKERIELAFLMADTILCKDKARIWSGTTVSLVVRLADIAFVANLGDSKTIVIGSGGKILDVTQDHKPIFAFEKTRIINMGGFITNNDGDQMRVNGVLAVSRSLGDCIFKYTSASPNPPFDVSITNYVWNGVVSGVPDIKHYRIVKQKKLVFLIATDGLFDLHYSHLQKHNSQLAKWVYGMVEKNDPHVCYQLVKHAKTISKDDITAVVVDVNFSHDNQ